ncbi:unnamed protein product [marine sediment metagenome]|uniref:Macro domain-containing protein n=1 Tax=marine sediment metagenome TaxID=412755 RepID=X1F799_9ZZZZ
MSFKYKIGNSILELIAGDITVQDTEAIVNAANKQLSPGGGVSGAIHRAAGPELWEECKTLEGCQTGEAKLSRGYNLKAKYVIHTVGPVYSSSKSDPEDLRDCYKNSLLLASRNKIKSVSFPSISTGIFSYPVKWSINVSFFKSLIICCALIISELSLNSTVQPNIPSFITPTGEIFINEGTL